LTLADDLAAIAKVAGRGDSEVRIAELLLRNGAPCSSGRWHKVKVHRRVEQMRGELGINAGGMRAGDIVARWRQQAEAATRRKAFDRSARAPDARICFRDDDQDENPTGG
jgi:hypothetical protein